MPCNAQGASHLSGKAGDGSFVGVPCIAGTPAGSKPQSHLEEVSQVIWTIIMF